MSDDNKDLIDLLPTGVQSELYALTVSIELVGGVMERAIAHVKGCDEAVCDMFDEVGKMRAAKDVLTSLQALIVSDQASTDPAVMLSLADLNPQLANYASKIGGGR